MDPNQVHARMVAVRKGKDEPERLYQDLHAESSEMLCAIMPGLASTGSAGAEYEAVRHGIDAILACRNTRELVAATARVTETMEKLDRSANRLAIVGLIVATVVGIAQIVVPVFVK